MVPTAFSRLLLVLLMPALAIAADGAPPASGTQIGKPVGVDAVVADPKAHAGPVTITGVVSQVFPKTGNFVLIDTAEYAACGDLTCAAVTLPVPTPNDEFTGELPAAADTVIVTGEVTPLDKGFKLTVSSVTRNNAVLRQRK